MKCPRKIELVHTNFLWLVLDQVLPRTIITFYFFPIYRYGKNGTAKGQ